ncbi:WAP four-disulfide core domain protein 3-like [Apteryx rowi]|uniref:WAP four-disulfide core domain protein 3-like n=1 Tax=Apteryx rowi TaxID=308060 RepID=UPI000E1C5CFF|nr:WAP four-disulfide core domain protein 3-like [Apteryx rowi]
MPGERALLLLLLALLPPAPAQPQGAGGRGAAPAAVPLPPPLRRAPRGRWPPAAVAVPSKAGECPAGSGGLPRPSRLYCLSDHSCPGAEKCCDAGQSRTCLLPATVSPGYCPAASSAGTDTCGTSCHNDTACGPGQKCCSLGCCARCVGAQPAKPGFCPRKRALRSGAACANQCADDHGCPGTHKCCFSGCGLACTPPDAGGGSVAAKPGACPVVLRGSLGPCTELCHGDGDCPGAAKCCSTGCGRICKPPMEGKATAASPSRCIAMRPGLCPPAATGDPATGCLALCLEDKDCPPGQKCCLLHCGRACVPPLWGKAGPSPGTPRRSGTLRLVPRLPSCGMAMAFLR